MISYPLSETFNKIRVPLLNTITGVKTGEAAENYGSENLIKHPGAFGILCIRATRAQKYGVSARGHARIGEGGIPETAAGFRGWWA
jgi:hypothetical protein